MLNTAKLDNSFWNVLRHIKHSLPRYFGYWGKWYAVWRVRRATKMHVVSGPFAGMLVAQEHVYGAPIAKLLGSYEKELHPYLSKIIHGGVQIVIDVGGAEGYYAIGMALQQSVKSVLVWECLEAGQKFIARLAQSNCVESKIEIQGECEESSLYEAIMMQGETDGILIMDVEGAELELLSRRVCEALRNWSFIVETHDFIKPGCMNDLIEKFKATHSINIVESRERNTGDFPLKMTLPPALKMWLMNEGRPTIMSWIVGVPNKILEKNRDSANSP